MIAEGNQGQLDIAIMVEVTQKRLKIIKTSQKEQKIDEESQKSIESRK
jgi:hypothetical protein